MRHLLISAACLLLAAGAASAQTKAGHYADYASRPDNKALIETPGTTSAPGHGVAPDTQTARIGPYRPLPGERMARHDMTRPHMMRHHVSARVCIARATARGLHGRAKTHYIQRCEVGRR